MAAHRDILTIAAAAFFVFALGTKRIQRERKNEG
jgi:hypothetical protein